MKLALVVGCNYPGTNHALAGCVNDKRDLEAVLDARGFDRIIGLEDNEATRENVLGYLNQLVGSAKADDLVWFSWSGHGTWTVDRSGDEPDRRDEALYMADGKLILDDDLYRIFTSGHRWTRYVMFSDSCHSGSVNRLAPRLGLNHKPSDPPTYSDRVNLHGRLAKFLPPAEWIDDEDELYDARRVELAPARSRPRPSALLLAACTDTQVAYDAWFSGRANGAFTYAALQALAENPRTYRDWQRGINARLPSVDFDQAPRLEAGAGQRRWVVFEETGER
jgi:metacaspase-1